jgi:type IV secretory pathway VirB10-like protein
MHNLISEVMTSITKKVPKQAAPAPEQLPPSDPNHPAANNPQVNKGPVQPAPQNPTPQNPNQPNPQNPNQTNPQNPSPTNLPPKQAAPEGDSALEQYAKQKGLQYLTDIDGNSSYTHLTGFHNSNSCQGKIVIGADPYNAPAILLTDSESGAKVLIWDAEKLMQALVPPLARWKKVIDDDALVSAMEQDIAREEGNL